MREETTQKGNKIRIEEGADKGGGNREGRKGVMFAGQRYSDNELSGFTLSRGWTEEEEGKWRSKVNGGRTWRRGRRR